MKSFFRFTGTALFAASLLFSSVALSQFKAWHSILGSQAEYIGMNSVNPNTIYAQRTDNYLCVSRDRGANWTALSILPQRNPIYGGPIRDIVVFPRDTNTIIACTFAADLWRSTDGGVTWTDVLDDNSVQDGFGVDGESIQFDPTHPDTAYAGCYFTGDIWQTIDRGATWHLQGSTRSPGSSIMCTLAIRPDSSNILYAGSGGGRISKSTDQGVTWRLVKSAGSTEIPKIAIDPVHPNLAYATAFVGSPGTEGVWKTTDYGESWNLTSLQISMWSLEMDRSHPDTLYSGTFANGNDGVYRTTDGGTTWTLMSNGYFSHNATWNLKIDPTNSNNVYAAVTNNDFGYYAILKLIDADAGVIGYVRDTLTSHIVNYGYIYSNPTNDFTDLVSSNGAFNYFRPVEDSTTPFSLNVYTGYLAKSQTIAFIKDSIITQDVLIQRGVIRGTVFNDANGNGVRDSGETALSNWPIQLLGTSAGMAHTDTGGHFQFADLIDGSYELNDFHEFGWADTHPNGSSYSITVNQNNKTFNGEDFGEQQLVLATPVVPARNRTAASVSSSITVSGSKGCDSTTVNDSTAWIVTGAWSGKHHGTFTFSNSDTLITFHPTTPFYAGEQVTVDITSNMKAQGGTAYTSCVYQFTAPAASSPGMFPVRRDFTVGGAPYAIAAGDLNGDGAVDLVTANLNSNNISVLINKSSGTFNPTVNYGTGSAPRTVALADMNGDGALDIVVGYSTPPGFEIFINHGDGTFAAGVTHSLGGAIQALAVADINGDGFPDVVAISGNSNQLYVAYNNGSGGISSTSGIAVSVPIACLVADLNNDGATDVATLSNSTAIAIQTATNIGGGSLF
ncbi:MAG TPA: FG-GAP-like repeat-containing protein, partial [Bacteroidota bacterium]|nr:FG-GAP-like repeat-containing protein [Bacteroidota bacterium]